MEPTTPQEIANNWVAWLKALASGEHKKAICTLHDTTDHANIRHCCLGVAQICLNLGSNNDTYAYDAIARHLGMECHPQHMNLVMDLNDANYRNDEDFINMHRELSERVGELTNSYPEVAPLVRKMLSEQNS